MGLYIQKGILYTFVGSVEIIRILDYMYRVTHQLSWK
jgi:hypothetical protein